MNRFVAFVASVVCCAATTVPARADILYSQPFDGSNVLNASQNDTNPDGFGNYAILYDNFTLATTARVTDIHWTGGYFNPPQQGPITAFTVTFWADAAGQPGAALLVENIPGNANETFLVSLPDALLYTYSADLPTAFSAQGGTQYWVSIVPDLGFPPQWGWSPGTGGDGLSYQDFFGERSPLGVDMAFTLTGTAATVPEPATLAVFGAAAIGAFGVRRRAKAKA
jgi:hypothetical protein